MCHPSAFPPTPSAPPAPANPDKLPRPHEHQPGASHEGAEPPAADVHVLAHLITPVRVWLDHYQYVALLRIKDALSRLAADLARDTQDSCGTDSKPAEPPAVCASLLLGALEIRLLLPPAVGEPPEEAASPDGSDSQSLTDSEDSLSRRHGNLDTLRDRGEDEHAAEPVGRAQGPEDDGEGEGSVEEACEAVEEGPAEQVAQGDQHVTTSVKTPPLPSGNPTVLCRDASTFSLEGELSSALSTTKDVTKDALSASLDLTKGALSITRDAFNILSRGSAMSKLFSTQNKVDEPSTPTRTRQALKHSSSQNSCDSATVESSTADDGVSVDSDTSENFIIVLDSDSGLDSIRPSGVVLHPDLRVSPALGTEGGSSAELSSSLSQSTEDITDDTVSVLLLSVGGVSSVVELHGEDVVVATEAQSLTPKQLGNQKTSELLAGLELAQGGSTSPTAPLSPGTRSPCRLPVVALRMEQGPSAGRHCTAAEGVGFLEVSVRGCRAELLSSTLNTLGPFLEDELSADPQPIRLAVYDTRLTLKDDGPKVYPTAPQPTPASFVLDGVVLERRHDDGILTLRSVGNQSRDRAAVVGHNHDATCCGPAGEGKTLESQLSDTRAALTAALSDRERLLLEIRKYDPSFNL